MLENEESRWLSKVEQVRKELENHKRSRNYYENRRKRSQKQLEALLAMDPRQMRIEIEDD